MNLTKKRWFILVACCLINLCLGSIYAWSVFASGMADYLTNLTGTTITNADLAIVYTIANAVGPITMISGGWFNDHFGPKIVILIGGAMFAAGMIISGFATSIPFLIVSYGLVSGLGLGMAYGSTISSCVKFFPDKRGLIGGITTAVYGMSSVILPPIVTVIVQNSDATTAFKAVGIAFLIIICVCALFIEKCPDDFVPDGYTVSKGAGPANVVNMTWNQMIKTPIFYCMMLLLMCGAFSGMMIISQASAVASNMIGMNAINASLAVSILALFNAFGRIVAGSISDKIGRAGTLTISCTISIIGLLLLYISNTGDVVTFMIGLAIVGMCFGSFMGVFPGFTADEFGPKNNSVNYGIMFIGFAIAGYFGPTIMRSIYISNNSYNNAFLIACLLNILGIIMCLLYKKFSAKKNVA